MQWSSIHNLATLRDASDRTLVQKVVINLAGRMYQQHVFRERESGTPPSSPPGREGGITLCVERDVFVNARNSANSTTTSVESSPGGIGSKADVLTGMNQWRFVVSDISDLHFTLWVGGFDLPMHQRLLSAIEQIAGPRLVNVLFSVHSRDAPTFGSRLACSHMSEEAMTHYKEVMRSGEYSVQIILLTALAAQTQNATGEDEASDICEETVEAVKQQLYMLQQGSPSDVNTASEITPTHANVLRANAIQTARQASPPVRLSASDTLWLGRLCSRIGTQCFDVNQASLRTLGHTYKRSVDTVVPEAMNVSISAQKPMIRGKRNPAYPGLQLQITGFQTLRFTTLIDWLHNTVGVTADRITNYWIAPCTVDVEANLLWFFTTNKSIEALELTIQIKPDKPRITATATPATAAEAPREEMKTPSTTHRPDRRAYDGVRTMEYPSRSVQTELGKRRVQDIYANSADDPANVHYRGQSRIGAITGVHGGNVFY